MKRNTIQKELVFNAVNTLRNHPTAEEVYKFISAEHPTVGKATVYRNLSAMCEEGKIKKIAVPDGADRFDHTCKEHYHIRCVKCGKMFDVDIGEDDIKSVIPRINDTHGFVFLSRDMIFNGICPQCNKEEKDNNG